MTVAPSPNFAFLAYHDPRLVALGTQAEQYFATDANVALYKLRQFCEVLAKRAAAKVGVLSDPRLDLARVIDALADKSAIDRTQRDLFHRLRRAGNEAVHDLANNQAEALHQLKVARELAVWFQRSFGNDRRFDPGPFVPPAPPKKPDAALSEELARLREHLSSHAKEADDARRAVEALRRAAEEEQAKRLDAEQLAAKAREEAAIWEALAAEKVASGEAAAAARTKELEGQNQRLLAELAALQAAAVAAPPAQQQETVARAAKASEQLSLDEAATRRIIDAQLRAAGWEADSERLTFESGTRPVKGRNIAIAEWPTQADGKPGRADYVLFAGLVAVGVVEAKKQHKNVAGVIPQAKRYSKGFLDKGAAELAEGAPWDGYRVPFLFATNGRSFLRQLADMSGIHYLDARRPTNLVTAIEGWPTPEGLLDRLECDVDQAHERLALDPMPYIEREYQRGAILAVERGIAEGRRALLVAMATGTGKTRTCIGLTYRLLKAKRFNRVLFLVDRSALGEQTATAFKHTRLEQLRSFTDVYEVKELGDLKPDRTTRLHIATIQAMTKRVLGGDGPEEIPPVDAYDCIVVDECHRGYLLDRELSDRDFEYRDEADYISKYRRVLDHFDAVKIGLTATPAIHTAEIFGAPVYQYSYREAVVDGFLVDHEPPLRIVTKLSSDGIHYDAREQVTVIDRTTQTVRKETLPDAVDFEVEDFQRNVITEGWNRAVLREVAQRIDPYGEGKTLIFCATDDHADMVGRVLKEELAAAHGEVADDAVLKITGASDRPLEAIRRFRNERHPNVAVTVDLLTTGIDVPKITSLVFMRGVRSRILYEQMIGRATRLCRDIGKEAFRIYDAVGLYDRLKDVSDMKPVVVDPKVTFEQLVREVTTAKDEEHRREALDELLAKLQRKKRALQNETVLAQFETAADMGFGELVQLLKGGSPSEVARYLGAHASLASLLDRTTGGWAKPVVVSEHVDELREVTRGYGKHGSSRPADYLESFRSFVLENMNKLPALIAVTQRPRDLTRDDLKKLKLALDEAGFGEASVQTAWREQKNEDVAATILGYVRRLAIGSPLLSYSERVDRALTRIKASRTFTAPQATYLRRLASALKQDVVVDRAALDREAFRAEGGFARFDKVFDGKGEAFLADLADEIWKDAG